MDEYQIIAIIAGIILILLLIVLSSRTRIFKTYEKYLKIGNKANITGKQLAIFSKEKLDLTNLKFALTDIKLGDAYSPKYETLILSKEVCDTASLSSLAIVSHELGHAVQDKNNSPLFVLCNILKAITRFTNKLIVPSLIVGLLLFLLKYPNADVGPTILIVSGCLFALHVLRLIITIPVEYDASRKALSHLKKYDLVSNSEYHKAKKLLRIAAQTYIASLLDDLFILNKKKRKKK